MRPRICLVATTAAAEHGDLLAARLRGLLDGDWEARLLCEGERWTRVPAFDDPALAPSVELMPERDWYPPPRSLLGRPGGLARYLGAKGETGTFDQSLLKLRPDLIHFQSVASARKAMRLKRLLDCRVAVSFRADGRGLDDPDLKTLWEGGDLLVFPDAALRDRAIARGCPPERAEVLPIPLRSLKPAMDGHRPKSGRLRVISAGPLTWEQGFEHSVHAVRLLLDMGIDCQYRILGEGEHLDAVGFARHQLDLAENVDLVSPNGGYPLEEELRAADAFVDPAVTDTTPPASLAMAHAAGIPFVATDRDGLPKDGGITVPRRNPGEIAGALATLAADPALRERMGKASQVSMREYPTFEDHMLRLEELYRRLLA
jgi:colanic acid/amylovoran biosynthesis glycosyltransferase